MVVDGRQFETSASPKMVMAIIAVVILLIAAIAAIVLAATAPARRAATAVFQTIATRGADVAWQQSSSDFRRAVPEPRFAAFVVTHRLAGFRSASWNRVSVTNSRASLAGSALLATSTLRARVALVADGDRWRLGALAVDDTLGVSGLP